MAPNIFLVVDATLNLCSTYAPSRILSLGDKHSRARFSA